MCQLWTWSRLRSIPSGEAENRMQWTLGGTWGIGGLASGPTATVRKSCEERRSIAGRVNSPSAGSALPLKARPLPFRRARRRYRRRPIPGIVPRCAPEHGAGGRVAGGRRLKPGPIRSCASRCVLGVSVTTRVTLAWRSTGEFVSRTAKRSSSCSIQSLMPGYWCKKDWRRSCAVRASLSWRAASTASSRRWRARS